jgi:DNA-binding NarL/FixJ family response regulator
MSPVKVLLVEDFEPIRALVVLLVQRAGFQVVGQASDGQEGVRKAEELKPDLVLLDIGLPRLDGIEAAKQIRNVAPNSKILFLSQESSLDIVKEALHLGATGYVHKCRLNRDLLLAMEAVHYGRRFVSSNLKVSHSIEGVTALNQALALPPNQNVTPLGGFSVAKAPGRDLSECISEKAETLRTMARFHAQRHA